MTAFNFNSKEIDTSSDFPVLPDDWYTAHIDKSEILSTKARDGQYLKLRFKILDGEYKKRVLFENFNIENNNPIAKRIAEKQLALLCQAVGVITLEDTQQLHGRPVKIKVAIEPAQGKYQESNVIVEFQSMESAPDSTRKNEAQPTAATHAPAPSSAGWLTPADTVSDGTQTDDDIPF